MKSQSTTAKKRTRARAAAVGTAVSKFRAARGMSIRQLASKADIAPSTLVRIEKPGDAPRSPAVDTLEALAGALECSLCEMLGEPANIEYHAMGDWPDALQAVLAKRGGYVTTTERVFIEDRLATLVHDPGRAAVGLPQVKDERDYYWQSQLQLFKDSAQWRTIENLVVYGWQINSDVLRGLALIVRDATRGALPSIEDGPTETGMAKKVTKKAKPKRKAGASKTAARKKTRRKKARS